MRDIALQVARESKDKKTHALREYLQNYLLFLMQKTKMNESLLFRVRGRSDGLYARGTPDTLSMTINKSGFLDSREFSVS